VCPQPNGTDESVHYDQWTLAAGEQTIVSHEYIVSRFWQVMDSPEPPSATAIAGEEKRHRCFCFCLTWCFHLKRDRFPRRQARRRDTSAKLKKRAVFVSEKEVVFSALLRLEGLVPDGQRGC
jgi:hypothetical protein